MAKHGARADVTARVKQALTELKISSTELGDVLQQLADVVTQAGPQASIGTDTIIAAGQDASGSFTVYYHDESNNTYYQAEWPQWAFELAKAAQLANKRVMVVSNGDPAGSNVVQVLIWSGPNTLGR
jgi:hypothetical protein